MDFGNRLKTLRTQKRLKTLELAEKINISESTYRRYERNEIAPDLNIITKIAEIAEIAVSDLLSDDKIIFNNQQSGGTSNNALIMNQHSEKVIEQFEIRIKEKDELIKGYGWINNERLYFLMDKGGDENYHIYASNIDGKNLIDLTPFEGVNASILKILKDQKDIIIVSMNKNNKQIFLSFSFIIFYF